jgi:hypothetical protein
MCRSTFDGGRRCPSHTDPVLIANRNARRRAKYAQTHINAKSNNTEAGERVLHSANASSFTHSLFTYKPSKNSLFAPQPNKNSQIIYEKAKEENENAFGVTTKEYEGYLVDNSYFSKKQNSGLLNYTKLDENSYKEFGFKDPDEPRYSEVDFKTLKELSESELQDHSIAEKKALKTFTSNDYKWINSALYGKGSLQKETPAEEEDYKPYYGDDLKTIDHSYTAEEKQTPSRFKELVNTLDRALDKGPKQQRILYRGMYAYHPAWGNPAGLEQYVNDNYAIGKEFKFDGYQSTTYNPIQAGGSAGEQGVLFEISTPSGVNVISVSEYDTEEEAILSRDARYMIVGLHKNVTFVSQSGPKSDYPSYKEGVTIVQMVEITEDGYVKDETNFTPPNPLKESQLKSYS